jgi:hypothetical protein
MIKSKYALLVCAFLLSVFLFVVPATASTWEYSEPSFEMADPTDPETTIMTCGHVPYSTTANTIGIFVSLNITDITYYPLPLPIETYALVNFTTQNGSVTQYDFKETNWYWGTGLSPVDLESSVPYQVGTYDIVGGLGTCQLVVDPEIEPMHVESTEYGNGWQIEHYSDGKTAYSNHPTYLRWDNVWIPQEWLNISNGNWSYKIQDNPANMSFLADGRTISIPKANTKFDLSLFKISPSLTYTKTALLNNMVSVNTTVGYLTFPYSLSQIKDYADEHNIKVGRWMFQAGQEHIEVYDDVKLNHTFVNETGQNETYLAVTTLNKSAYQFKIVNDEIRLYFLKAEANKMSGNITFELKSWTVGEGGNAWTGNSSKDNTTLNRDTNRIMLRQEVDDYISYWRFDGISGTTAYDENATSNNNGTLTAMNMGLNNGSSGWNSTQCKFGSCISFDGTNDYVNIGTSSILKPPLPITLSIWIYLNSTYNPATNYGWINNDGIYGVGSYSGVSINDWGDGTVSTDFGDGLGSGLEHRRSKSGTTVLNKQQWYHIIGIIRGATNMSIYINGIDDGGTYSGSGGVLAYRGLSAQIGATQGLYPFKGIIDSPRIYSRALTNNEINLTMNNSMKSSGNLTTWYNSGAGNETYQVDVNATTQSNSNYSAFYRTNGTGAWTAIGTANSTGNQSITLTTKYQNTDLKIELYGNGTATPSLITTTFWTQSATGGTLYERSVSQGITVANSAERKLTANREASAPITISDSTERTAWYYRSTDISLSVANSIGRTLYAFRNVAASITVADSVNATYYDIGEFFERSVSQTITITDTVNATFYDLGVLFERTAEQVITLSDSAGRLLTANRNAEQAITVSHTAARTLIANRAVQQAITITDSVVRITSTLYLRTVSEVITVTDSVLTEFIAGVDYIVSGFVTNVLAAPLQNARVEYVGGNYAFTDAAGYYNISVPAGTREILGRAIGYENLTEEIVITGNTALNMTLPEFRPPDYTSLIESILGIVVVLMALIIVAVKRKKRKQVNINNMENDNNSW